MRARCSEPGSPNPHVNPLIRTWAAPPTLQLAGLRANNTPCQTPLCPKRRPPRPQQPIFSVFDRGGLHFERHTASSRGFSATKREFCIISGFRVSITGPCANNTPCQTPLCPKRRPPRPQQPIFSVFDRGGLHFERHTASSRGFSATKREFCIIRTPARRQPAPNSVKSHRHRCGEHGKSGGYGCGARGRRRGLDGLRDDAPSNVSHHSPTGVVGAGGIGGPGCGAGGRRRGLDGLRDDAPINVSHHSPTGVVGAGGIRGPCCSAGGWRWGLDGLRDDAPSNVSHHSPTGVEGTGGIGGPGCGAGGRRRGLAGLRDDAPSNVSHHSPTGVEGAGGIRGPCCSARGRRRGLDGLRDDAPSNVSHHSPTGVEGAGGPGGPGRASRRGAERSEDAKSRGRPGSPAPGTPVGHAQQPGPTGTHSSPEHPWGTRETAGARSAAAPRAPHSRASVAHRLSWMLRPGTASISSRV